MGLGDLAQHGDLFDGDGIHNALGSRAEATDIGWHPKAANGLELCCPAEAGGSSHTLAPAGEQGKLHADSAEQPGRHLVGPHWQA